MADGMLLWQNLVWTKQERIYILGALLGITGELTIPEGVTDIYSDFNYCTNLTHICVSVGNRI